MLLVLIPTSFKSRIIQLSTLMFYIEYYSYIMQFVLYLIINILIEINEIICTLFSVFKSAFFMFEYSIMFVILILYYKLIIIKKNTY